MRFKFLSKDKIDKLPRSPGAYAFEKGAKLLYIGKAANIRDRVKNHFQSAFAKASARQATKDNLFIDKVTRVGYFKTDSEIEALILEANLIKKYQPKYNVIWKDDKNYFFVGVTKEDFPRVFLTHQPAKIFPPKKLRRTSQKSIYNLQFTIYNFAGPFVDGKALKQTLKILRKVFPYRSCSILPKRACLWYHLERCPAPCLIKTQLEEKILFDRIKRECQKNAENVFKIFQGEKTQVLKSLKKEMKEVSRLQDFERAAKIRDQILALEKILAHARLPGLRPGEVGQAKIFEWRNIEEELKKLLKTKKKISKIEAYDVSNIQGQLATGAMVTFLKGKPEKNFYRKFKIKTPHQKFGGGANDLLMLKEVLSRRFKHIEWPFPDLILIDGGKAQLNASLRCLRWNLKHSIRTKVVALAKRKNELFIEKKKTPVLLKKLPREIFNLILQLRDEAHRFAISYHKKLREKKLLTPHQFR